MPSSAGVLLDIDGTLLEQPADAPARALPGAVEAVGLLARRGPVRFVTNISPVFPASDIQGAVEFDDDRPSQIQVNFMGVANPTTFGALPRRYAEEIRRLEKEKNSALREFLDLFNHRMISLF